MFLFKPKNVTEWNRRGLFFTYVLSVIFLALTLWLEFLFYAYWGFSSSFILLALLYAVVARRIFQVLLKQFTLNSVSKIKIRDGLPAGKKVFVQFDEPKKRKYFARGSVSDKTVGEGIFVDIKAVFFAMGPFDYELHQKLLFREQLYV